MSRIAIQLVLDYLKKKLPAPIASQIDAILVIGASNQDMLKGLGGLLGKKK